MDNVTNPSKRRRPQSLQRALRHHPVFRWLDARFMRRPRIYIGQSLLAGVALGVILFAETNVNQPGLIVVAVASSVAVVFFAPHSVASSPSRIIGGHAMAVVAAYIAFGVVLLTPESVETARWMLNLSGGIALAVVILLMTISNTEHAPAAGTALALANTRVPTDAVLFIPTAAALIALVRTVLGPRLHNLI